MAVVPHLTASPNLAPCNFFFPRIQLQLQGHFSQDVPEINKRSLTVLHMIPVYEFQWQKRQTYCMNSGRDYIEGDDDNHDHHHHHQQNKNK
jgi:hypothetical protein